MANLEITKKGVLDIITPNNTHDDENLESHHQLLNHNSGILNILPSLLEGIIVQESPYSVLMRHLNQTMLTNSSVELRQLRNKVISLTSEGKDVSSSPTLTRIDKNKNVMLTLTFGETYLNAIEIVSQDWQWMEVEVLGIEARKFDHIRKRELVLQYLSRMQKPPELDSCLLKITVKQKIAYPGKKTTQLRLQQEQELLKELHELELRQMLQKVGLDYDGDGVLRKVSESEDNEKFTDTKYISKRVSEIKKVLEPDSFTRQNLVDFENWYCNCEEYQECYLESEQDAIPRKIISPNQLLSLYGAAESETGRLQNSKLTEMLRKCPTNLVDPIPLCSHLVSVLMVALNGMDGKWDVGE
ncbi:predicted protein [Scheffersomyces stipitis CBS 6054]|uniref:Uncharacterized protein n=1 Tax=Scheffersomyces stipitis (strain ATCC 58785 / CBS 6054 / NBRC 10063 / NRRL Y-11545) TaxID=322104 RepID=A3LUR0_PICST|nr:predicted protein [Scheffersomyces stipitis CBS 6054]ABN66633.2 predicted protein [Scheffersomyces stipitis CBS 6054]